MWKLLNIKNSFGILLLVFAGLSVGESTAAAQLLSAQQRMVEWTIESQKTYSDPFNDVDVDVIFTRGKQSWRVPTFWRGGNRWTVRFAPPTPGEYSFRLESTDRSNPDLNGHDGHVSVTPYAGSNPLFRHGMLQVSANKRYLEHADGTPFYWLGDTWWMGLSDRLPWSGFQELTADRKAKGFTVVQITAGLVPFEELCPQDPGCANEGGPAWEADFARINPGYFDAADRRIQYLIDSGLVPEIEGAYQNVLGQIGVTKMKQHWRYIVARYAAYPVLWNLADEATDPPPDIARQVPERYRWVLSPPGTWTEIAGYIRSVDPNHHPLTVNEWVQPVDFPLQKESLTDFDQLQPAHLGWPSIGNEVMQLDKRYSRTDLTKPVVVGEIGYEQLFGMHFEDFQRMAFWIATLNGAAGYTYGAAPTYEVNNPEKPIHRIQYTFQTWQEGMALPGSYQVGLGGKLLQRYPWWRFAPHPEWVVPRGTTLLEPHQGRQFNADNFDFGLLTNADGTPTYESLTAAEATVPGGEWKARHGTFRRPYAAGIPGTVRVIYTSGFPVPPTVLNLELGVRYHAYYWDPTQGIEFDLGQVSVPTPGDIEFEDTFNGANPKAWSERGAAKAQRKNGKLVADGETLSVVDQIALRDGVVSVDVLSTASSGVLLRYQDDANYVAAVYSAQDKLLYFVTRINGVTSEKLGAVPVPLLGGSVRLSAEVRSKWGATSIADGKQTFSTPIVDIAPPAPELSVSQQDESQLKAGSVGLWHPADTRSQQFENFQVRKSPTIAPQESLNRKLYDAHGTYRGELSGPGWDDWGKSNAILLSSYRPERFPTTQDWVLVLENSQFASNAGGRYFRLTGVPNFREVTGYKTNDGRLLRDHVLYRSGDISGMTTDDEGVFQEIGISSEIDLRGPKERAQYPNRWTAATPALFTPFRELTITNRESGRDVYIDIAIKHAPDIGRALRSLATASKPALLHCAAGSDRTGVTVAILMKLLDIRAESISEEYLRSNVYWASVGETSDPLTAALLEQTMRTVSNHYGSFADYTSKGLGLSQRDIEALKSAFLTPK